MMYASRTFDPVDILMRFPPKVKDRNVRMVYDIANATDTTFKGPIRYSRHGEEPLPAHVPVPITTTDAPSPDFFRYDPTEAADPGKVVWHLNFAHYDLFRYYGSGLFAQDEMQVAEHPVLASLREALVHEKLSTLTVEEGRPTPILIRGAERRVSVATNPNASEGRPSGLYGNRFSQAQPDVVRRAITKLNPSTISNIIAMEAPPGGSGDYTVAQIRYILSTAYTAFHAAKQESTAPHPGTSTTIHTGYWGCGAYGGNRILMTMLQLHAAQLAQVDQLVFHTGDKYELQPYKTAKETLQIIQRESADTESFIQRVARQGYRWGVSDGN
jgi:hypothetical protein